MAHKEPIDGEKKPKRGRPFKKGRIPHNKRNADATLLDDSGHQSGDERGIIAPEPRSAIVEPLNEEISPLAKLPELVLGIADSITKENLQSPKEESKEAAPLEKIDEIDFYNGTNKLSIRFSKRINRMFRIQIFLNDETEIRNMTYHGSATAHSFWSMLKGALKK